MRTAQTASRMVFSRMVISGIAGLYHADLKPSIGNVSLAAPYQLKEMQTFIERLARSPWLHYWEQRLMGLDFYPRVRKLLHTEGFFESHRHILEMGCGQGIISEWFKRQPYIGMDLDRSSLKLASSLSSGLFLCADATRLCFKDGAFDGVISVGLLHHLDDESFAGHFKQALRVLKSGGKLIVSDSLKPEPRDRFRSWFSGFERGAYLRTHEQLLQCLKKAGLTLHRYHKTPTLFLQSYFLVILKS